MNLFPPADQLRALRAMMHTSWSADTANNPDAWTPEVPSKGQCAVTALIVDDTLGLPLVRGRAFLPDGTTESHYWNEGVDLTAAQFPVGTTFEPRDDGPQGSDARAYVLGNADLAQRYATLRDRTSRSPAAPVVPITFLYQIDDSEEGLIEAAEIGSHCLMIVAEETFFRKNACLNDAGVLEEICRETCLTGLDAYMDEIAESMFSCELAPDAMRRHLNATGFFREEALFD
jgi:hypothetical protein